MKYLISTFFALSLILSTPSCGGSKTASGPKHILAQADSGAELSSDVLVKTALIDRIGGRDGVQNLIDSFLTFGVTDQRISKFFPSKKKGDKRYDVFKEFLVERICELAGGPCQYDGPGVILGGKSAKFGVAQWQVMKEDLLVVMAENKIEEPDRLDLLKRIEPIGDQMATRSK